MTATLGAVTDGMAGAGDHEDRQAWDAPTAGIRLPRDAADQVDPQLPGRAEAAQRIGDVGIDLGRIARQPVGIRAVGPEAPVEFDERHLQQQRTAPPRSPAPALEARDQLAQGRDWGRLAVRPAQDRADIVRAAFGDRPLGQERAHGMAEDRHWQAGMVAADPFAQQRHVVEDAAPAVLICEEAEIVRGGRRAAMPAMVVGMHGVAGIGQRPARRPSGRLLAQPVGELDPLGARRRAASGARAGRSRPSAVSV